MERSFLELFGVPGSGPSASTVRPPTIACREHDAAAAAAGGFDPAVLGLGPNRPRRFQRASDRNATRRNARLSPTRAAAEERARYRRRLAIRAARGCRPVGLDLTLGRGADPAGRFGRVKDRDPARDAGPHADRPTRRLPGGRRRAATSSCWPTTTPAPRASCTIGVRPQSCSRLRYRRAVGEGRR